MGDYEDIAKFAKNGKGKVTNIKSPIKPLVPIKSIQMDLFSKFVTNDINEVSNTIELWERIPKYFPIRTLDKMQPDSGQAPPYEWEYAEGGDTFMVVVQPASIKVDGVYKSFFPSVSEELIEEALKKILADQNHAIHDPEKYITWVTYSLNMLYRELKDKGCTRSFSEIRHSLYVMSKCNISFLKNGEEIWNGALLQEPVSVRRKDYLANPDALFSARLPVFISYAINELAYRQFNYKRLMSCNSPLSRLLYKKLIHRYTQASLMNDYHFMYSDLKKCGLLQQTRESDNRAKVLDALNELVKRNVLSTFSHSERKQGKKILDVKYLLHPSSEFVKEQKASNLRTSENKSTLSNKQAAIVDKSEIGTRFKPR